MELTMKNNLVNLAKNQLARHKELGAGSTLTIQEVARLMDLVTFGPQTHQVPSRSLFFNYLAN